MNKAQLIDALASKYDGNRRTASAALEAVLDTITRTVVTGEKVGITGFGVFEKLDKPARTVRNPATGASVKKKKTSVPRFRPGAELKAYVSGEKKFARVPVARKTAVKTAAAPVKATAVKTAAAKPAAKTTPAATTAAKSTPAKTATKTAAAKTTAVKTARTTAKATAPAAKSTATKSAATKAAPTKRAARKA